MALPASAEAGKLFDFNLTLPISEWRCYSRSSNSSTSVLGLNGRLSRAHGI